MRLIKCKKCGATVCTEDAMIERMSDTIHDLHEKARHSRGENKQSYMQEAAAVKKMLTQIIHTTAQMEDRKTTKNMELTEIIHYIRENHLITDEKLHELQENARRKAEERNKADQEVIEKVYGEYKTTYNPFNSTKADKTSMSAIANTMRKAEKVKK